MFIPTYLYVKTHNTTGLKYFGKTIRDPFKYKGSGTRWLNHLRYHGNDVTTEVIGYYLTEDECKKTALLYSETHNIVESSAWANLEPEDGLNGGYGSKGEKNGSFGSHWITNGKENKKVLKAHAVPDGWTKGRTMPASWGDNVRNKLKGKTQVELLGEERATELKEQKRQRMLGNKIAKECH